MCIELFCAVKYDTWSCRCEQVLLGGLTVPTFALADFLLASSSAALDISTAAVTPSSAPVASAAVASALASILFKALACAFFDTCAADFSCSGQ